MLRKSAPVLALIALVLAIILTPAYANDHIATVNVNLTETRGIGAEVGTVTLKDTQHGLLITPDLENLTPGLHGFHIHQNPACGPGLKQGKPVAGLAAGGHFDPFEVGAHAGPYSAGHLGDLPPLYVSEDGTATMPVLAPRLEVSFVNNRSLMIHKNGDNFSDDPALLGGGGPREACGVIAE
ncbi:superoxide dismutase [Leptolyngbya sp. Heron Island J]|uniref:superoxide dismutase family protein n=1 Tax=Leptolyngbya sp. Heron Island J TaxID=1385935 RepID=UPI0003B97089|nr:superoxide dismutase family protein [Leptolyngbya sp. Heron Island J]ESA35077.1 superoxide dismutase [Leptolyngbya sp. Heron Island J]